MNKVNQIYAKILIINVLLVGCANHKYNKAPVESAYIRSNMAYNSLKSKTYEVKKGDTLYAIAWRAGTDYRQLARINNIDYPYQIYPHQTIMLNHAVVKTSQFNDSKSLEDKVVKNSSKNVVKKLAHQKQGEYRQPNQKPSRVITTAPQATQQHVVQQSKQLVKPVITKSLTPQKSSKANKTSNSTKVSGNTKVSDNTKVSSKKDPSTQLYSNKIREWVWPTTGKVVAGFSTRKNGNKGIDIIAPAGTDIVSAADGKVVYYGNALRGYGNLVIIKHNDDYLSAYAHNRKVFVKEKQLVRAGQKIAEMGNSDSENIKLHFEVRYRGKSVNPIKYLPKR